MAEGVRALCGSDLGIATTGIAGPDGGSAEKPVGTVYIAIASPDGCSVFHYSFSGDRDTIRETTSETALELLSGTLLP